MSEQESVHKCECVGKHVCVYWSKLKRGCVCVFFMRERGREGEGERERERERVKSEIG